MTKKYFGRKNGKLNPIYTVAFDDCDEMLTFTKLISIKYGRDKYQNVSEMFEDYRTAVAYAIWDTEDKKDFEEEYREIKNFITRQRKARTIVY